MDSREISSPEALTELIGEPAVRVVNKERPRLHDLDRDWLASSPFCLLATADAEGNCDVSPKGDPAGQLVHVIDDTTIAIAERPGNKRVDGYHNVLVNPHVGLLFMIPGRGDTLRINGRARLVSDAPYFDALAVKQRRPILALECRIDTIFFHCAKAFLRSALWKPETWHPELVDDRPRIAQQLERPEDSLEELREYYSERTYSAGLY